jgi:hypothetical protein
VFNGCYYTNYQISPGTMDPSPACIDCVGILIQMCISAQFDQDLCESIKYIFYLLSEGAIHRNLSSVIDDYPHSDGWLTQAEEDAKEDAKELYESFDTLQKRIIESLPECSKDFVDNEFNEFANAFEYYQESTGRSIDSFHSDVDGFDTVCTEFVTQLAIARDAVVKLLAMRN